MSSETWRRGRKKQKQPHRGDTQEHKATEKDQKKWGEGEGGLERQVKTPSLREQGKEEGRGEGRGESS